ncbi:NAD(P)-binding protein [Sodiomyces alkalinus F11]|uniref:NAD(P)-binding protein n=1 Tax=Sodiomyces alkalinus (strain CBS 110278 / VKM F-3762 / F11) TaxID=1314773 RepID=A0A3N2Q856_SODAK|nr:NAD(P)-binding protein [Sodiomyces alkalinus F11]ROT42961.1 NAD(P)-binding protein [Sodiomyces alkalinus F11]
MTRKLITVLGITGTQGGSVANRFLNLTHAEWQVRGLTRNPGSAKAKEWAGRGVEIVKGDHDDVESLKAAFKGAHAIFAVTDWAANYFRVSEDKALQEKAKAAGRTIEEYAGDLEKAQGIKVATAASDPAVLSTLERFVFSTLTAVQKISGGKYKHAYEFDSKADVESHIREHLPELRARLSTVTMGIFQENWKDIPAFRAQKKPDGTYEFLRLNVPGSHLATPEVVASRDTGAFVEALVFHHPPGTDVLGASEIISRPDYAALWGRTMGVKATARDVEKEEYLKYIPEGMETTIVDDLGFFTEYGYAGGNPNVKTPAELGIKTTSLEEFFRDQDWSGVLKGEL